MKTIKALQPVIPAKAKPRAGIQGDNVWMPDQVRHDKYTDIFYNLLSIVCVIYGREKLILMAESEMRTCVL